MLLTVLIKVYYVIENTLNMLTVSSNFVFYFVRVNEQLTQLKVWVKLMQLGHFIHLLD